MRLPSHDRSLAQQLRGAFTLFAALVAAAFFLTALAYTATRAWVTPAREANQAAMEAERDAFGAMVDQENGLRGFLLTRDVRFLEPYTRGELVLGHANNFLTSSPASFVSL